MTDLTPMENLQLALQELRDSERTIFCSPEWESRIKSMIATSPCAGLWTVVVMPGMADDRYYVLDHHAMEATARQAMQRDLNTPMLFADPQRDLPLTSRYRWLDSTWGYPRGDDNPNPFLGISTT